MSPFSIIEHLDIFKDTLSCLRSGFVIFVIDKLIFQRTKKAFGNRIVQALAFSAHAAT
jgi:hypothetical protein